MFSVASLTDTAGRGDGVALATGCGDGVALAGAEVGVAGGEVGDATVVGLRVMVGATLAGVV